MRFACCNFARGCGPERLCNEVAVAEVAESLPARTPPAASTFAPSVSGARPLLLLPSALLDSLHNLWAHYRRRAECAPAGSLLQANFLQSAPFPRNTPRRWNGVRTQECEAVMVLTSFSHRRNPPGHSAVWKPSSFVPPPPSADV